MTDENVVNSKASQFILYIAGGALAVAFIIQPLVKLYCAVYYPSVTIPTIDLKDMWVPVSGITGLGGLSVLKGFLAQREERKTKEVEQIRCATCPTNDCANCPLKSLKPASAAPI